MTDEEKWKKRFHLFALVRLVGLALFFLGIAIALTGILREGGWPLVGGIVAILGAVDAVLAPKMLKAAWDREDR
ncbi:MAG: hypothetical protein M3Q52_11225 [Pseudomonadota bacterium]|nr:hypothetical protein [Pseudomonadota bacterium]